MQYMLLIYVDRGGWNGAQRGRAERDVRRLRRLHRGDQGEGPYVGRRRSSSRSTAATTVRVRDGETLVTDGPFAETKEQLGGYYLIEAEDARRGDRVGRADPVGALRRRSRCGRSSITSAEDGADDAVEPRLPGGVGRACSRS